MSIELLEAVAGEREGTKSVASALSDDDETKAAIDGVGEGGGGGEEESLDDDGVPAL